MIQGKSLIDACDKYAVARSSIVEKEEYWDFELASP